LREQGELGVESAAAAPKRSIAAITSLADKCGLQVRVRDSMFGRGRMCACEQMLTHLQFLSKRPKK